MKSWNLRRAKCKFLKTQKRRSLAETRNYLITHRVNNGVKIFHLDPFPSAVTPVSASTLLSNNLKHKPRMRWWIFRFENTTKNRTNSVEKTDLGIRRGGQQQRRGSRIAILAHAFESKVNVLNVGRWNLNARVFGFGALGFVCGELDLVRGWVREGRGKEREL